MVRVVFEYMDRYTNGEWNRQKCIVESVEECKEIYGLGIDCSYRILVWRKCRIWNISTKKQRELLSRN